MNWFRRILGAWSARSTSFWSGQLSWGALVPGGLSSGGVSVTPASALGLSAYYAAVNRISTDVACLPLQVFKRRKDGGRDEARDHPVSRLLSVSPDGETTPMRQRQALMGHVLGWGNGYCEVVWRDGYPEGIYLLDPSKMRPKWREQDLRLYYQYGTKSVPAWRTLHVAGLGFDGLTGYSVAQYARDAVALGMAQEGQNTKLYTGARPGGVIKLPYKLQDAKAVETLRKGWDADYGGDNAGKTAVLEQGADFVPLAINPVDAQFIESRQFQVIEIARWFGIPPHKIGDYSQTGSAYRALEESNLDYLTTVVMPKCREVEQEFNRKLFTPEEQKAGFYCEHNLDAFLRGNSEARAKHYRALMGLSAITPNQIAARENLNPYGSEGDTRFVDTTLQTLENALAAKATPEPATPPTQEAPADAG